MIKCKKHQTPGVRRLFLQVAYDATLKISAERDLEYDFTSNSYIRSGWREHKKGFKKGLYCKHCLGEGKKSLLPFDIDDIKDEKLDDNALIFRDASTFHVDDVWPTFLKNFSDFMVEYQDFPSKPETFFDDIDSLGLRPELKKELFGNILPADARLYAHQGLAIRSIFDGKDVVIETPTASGKSLCYTLPTLQACLKDRTSTILYISPLNALSENQLDNFSRFDSAHRDWGAEARKDSLFQFYRQIQLGKTKISVSRYDGLIKNNDIKRRIRQNKPNVLITNPEMLHWGILSWAKPDYWEYLFRNLKYVIIDEVHVYKGIFGANFANLMRRLQRLCYFEGAKPTFIGCSATIKNPEELFRKLIGRPASLIGANLDGAPVRRRRFVLMDGSKTKDSLTTDTKNILGLLVGAQRTKTIAFLRSIAGVDAVYRTLHEDLHRKYKIPPDIVCHFKKELRPETKAAITANLRSGRVHGVISTTALQLGIDIGDLSACVISKYPGSIASVWQQAGRAGRKGEGLVILLLDEDPLNQYFVDHPDDFFAMEPEDVFVDPDNPHIVLDHLWCATKDRPLDLDVDRKFFGDGIEAYVGELKKKGHLKLDEARDVFILKDPDGFPAAEVPIRAIGFEFPVLDESGNKILNPDASRAARYFHKYARFQAEERIYDLNFASVD